MSKQKRYVDIDEKLPVLKAALLGAQHFMSMFGGTVLVPLLIGFPPSIALMCSGIGTLIYLVVTRSKIPSYLGPSFAFIAPLGLASAYCTQAELQSGIVAVGVIFVAIAFIVKMAGTAWIDKYFPPILVASLIFVISCGLSGTAVEMALVADGSMAPWQHLLCAFCAFAVVVFFSGLEGHFVSNISVLMGVIASCVLAGFLGLFDITPVLESPWFGVPHVIAPVVSARAILLIAPVAFVLAIDHMGHLFVVGEVTGRNFMPLFHRSLLGDGLATIFAGFCGAPPATTFAENMGVMSVTRVFATQIFWYAGVLAFVIGGFCPKLEALISAIPDCVIGGVSVVIFGLIACNALRMLVARTVNLDIVRNTMIVAPVIVVGIGMSVAGITIPLGDYPVPGFAFALVMGFLLNLVLPRSKSDELDFQDKTMPHF